MRKVCPMRNACYRCGSLKHKANFKSCPTLDHYSKVCFADGSKPLEEAETGTKDYVLTIDMTDHVSIAPSRSKVHRLMC